MKKNILRIILAVLLLWTFFIIFGFSSQDGEQSGNLSKKITSITINTVPQLRNLEENQKEEIAVKMEKIIRKMAHFSIYTLVGILLMSFISTYKIPQQYRAGISFITGIIYAISDEIHQKFVPGRSPQITDVMIDTMGVILGILIVMTVLEISKIIKLHKSGKVSTKYT